MATTTIDQIIAEKLGSWYVGEWPIGNLLLCVIAVLLAVLLCGAIGMERELRGHSAGLRTHLLVGVGSCIVMIISIYGFPKIFESHRDVARIAAQVVTGVGFLGAGAIIHRNSGIRGLTTAATIWIAMAIGLACGSMNFILAAGSTALILIVLTLFRRFELRLNKKAPLVIVRSKADAPLAGRLLDVAEKRSCRIENLKIESNADGEVEATFLAMSRGGDSVDRTQLVADIEAIEGVIHVDIINAHQN